MPLPEINSITVERVEGGWLAHGCCSLGPVHRMGLTEQMAIHNAAQQIREYMRQHAAERAVKFRAKYPNYTKENAA